MVSVARIRAALFSSLPFCIAGAVAAAVLLAYSGYASVSELARTDPLRLEAVALSAPATVTAKRSDMAPPRRGKTPRAGYKTYYVDYEFADADGTWFARTDLVSAHRFEIASVGDKVTAYYYPGYPAGSSLFARSIKPEGRGLAGVLPPIVFVAAIGLLALFVNQVRFLHTGRAFF